MVYSGVDNNDLLATAGNVENITAGSFMNMAKYMQPQLAQLIHSRG